MRMTSRALFLIIAAIIAWIMAFNTGHPIAYSLAYLLSGILLLSYFWARSSIGGIHLRRFTHSRRSQVGQFAEEQFEVTNRSVWPKLWVEIEDFSTLPWHDAASRVVNGLGRKRNYRWHVRTLCTQRGQYRLGPMTIQSGDPLGVFNVTQELPQTSYLVVYPLAVDLTSFEPSISDLAGGEARHRRTYQMTTNAAGVRDYYPGDSLNRIHWPTTARMRRLMTKEFELDPTADIWLYLDLSRDTVAAMPWQPEPPEYGLFALDRSGKRRSVQSNLPPISTEYAVTVTASLARFFLTRNRAVGMNSHGRMREFLQADRGERQLNKIMEALAVVDGVGNLPFEQLIATDGIRLNRNDTLLAVSADPRLEWAYALQMLQRRGVNSIAVVIDGSTFGRATDYTPVLAQLEAAGVPTYVVRRDEAIDAALAHPFRGGARRAA
ncbi:MAG: DUF58 domain-containing protein [Caldilineaceae bacterium]|nr:DUF58 domain-containing protein [Caldilineaceae bacterium]